MLVFLSCILFLSHTQMHIDTYTHTQAHLRAQIRSSLTHTHTHMHTCMHTHTYIHTYTRTHMTRYQFTHPTGICICRSMRRMALFTYFKNGLVVRTSNSQSYDHEFNFSNFIWIESLTETEWRCIERHHEIWNYTWYGRSDNFYSTHLLSFALPVSVSLSISLSLSFSLSTSLSATLFLSSDSLSISLSNSLSLSLFHPLTLSLSLSISLFFSLPLSLNLSLFLSLSLLFFFFSPITLFSSLRRVGCTFIEAVWSFSN